MPDLTVPAPRPALPPARRRHRLALGLIIALGLVGMGVLMAEVVQKLDALRSAEADTLQWALSQVEVEFLLLNDTAMMTEMHDGADLAPLRRRFDIFDSQLRTVLTSPAFAPVRGDPKSRIMLDRLQAFTERMETLVDGPDDALRAALPALGPQMVALRPDLRALTLDGLAVFARLSDLRREGFASTLFRLALLAIGLILSLLALVAVLARLNRVNRARMAEIVETRARLRTILVTALDAVLVTDAAGRVQEVNPAAEAMFGLTAAEARGQALNGLVFATAEQTADDAGLADYMASGAPARIGRGLARLAARRRDGSAFPVELSLASALDAAGMICIVVIRDISAQIAADNALREARDRALAGERTKAEFLAVMSHEMRTPLNGLLGTVDLMARTDLDDRQRDYIGIMQTSGRLLLRHVNDVLDIAKAESGHAMAAPEPFDLGALMAEVVTSQRSLAEAAGDELTLDLPDPPLGPFWGDPARLRQVLLNLVGNAVKFTERGQITVAARALPGARLELRVTDTGIGIAEPDQARIFSDFVTLDTSYRRNTEGTGLGLGIARRMVEAMGGEIGVDSAPGRGSSFWLRLPLSPAAGASPPLPAPAPAPTPTGPPLDILLVEDNRINRFVAREMLEAEGHRVTDVADGRAGAALACARRFDLILMDISMPEMDGIEATQTIRAAPGGSHDAPIVALTAHAQPEDRARFRDAGMTDSLTKPITRAALTALLACIAGHRPAAAPVPAPTGVLDLAHLAEMEADLGAPSLATLARRFLDEGEALIPPLAIGPLPSDIADRVHKLAGSAGVFGARPLAARLADIEVAARAGDEAACAADLPALATLWAETSAALVRHLEKTAP